MVLFRREHKLGLFPEIRLCRPLAELISNAVLSQAGQVRGSGYDCPQHMA